MKSTRKFIIGSLLLFIVLAIGTWGMFNQVPTLLRCLQYGSSFGTGYMITSALLNDKSLIKPFCALISLSCAYIIFLLIYLN